MDQNEKVETRKKNLNSTKLSSAPDIDQLCDLIDENTFGLKSFSSSSSKFHSVPSTQIKAFRSSRLKRLHTPATNFNDHENFSLLPSTNRTISMRFTLSSTLLDQFRSLSTYNLPKSRRRYSSPTTITLFRTKSIPSTDTKEENNSSTTSLSQSQLSCTIVDTRRTTAHSCNVEELAAYLDNFLYLPKSLSGAAELMYT
ncbi:unnamed protein product [Adineta steineri]|uniref:Peroxide-inducible transcript 1 protein n=1 Tax=Adineta steineri TaxID=433720 RepID=A0A819BFB3_9BILA|nr:unnamed protein product [Adineta steineri]CAF3800388.1 unnamed protein product [Adineta steineri]